MLRKDNFFSGVLIGAVLPAIAWVFFDMIFKDVLIMRKHGVPYIIVIAVNLLVLRYNYKINRDNTGMGIMLVTFIFALMVFMFKFKQ